MERLTRRKEDIPGRWEYDCSTKEIIDKLAEYEDLEEQGKLLRLAEPVINNYTLIIRNRKAHYLAREIDLEEDIIEIECAIKSQIECDNMFTVSILQKCLKMYDELKSYRDLEEQGKLLKLPVAVGDIVYVIELDEENFTAFHAPLRIAEYEFSLEMIGMLELFGKCIFTTKEAAEAALKEMEK